LSEPIIVQQGDYVNGITIIRSGFGRVSRIFGSSEYTSHYLSKGQIFGLEEVAFNWQHEDLLPHQMTLRAVGYIDTLFIPARLIEKYVLGPDKGNPIVDESLIPPLPTTHRDTVDHEAFQSGLPSPVMEQIMENRIMNGTATMVIDLDRCTRCDDCVKACADAHDGNPRFVRHGIQIEHIMVANACMHCADPVCMIGCPTAAIHRDRDSGQILINDPTCVGCATCANSCPYNNIRMVEIRDPSGRLMRETDTNRPILKATKCDLCIDELGGPACQRACPHDALQRIDIQNGPEDLRQWLSR
jgi:Fe-S-cluster-containing dehydrogenase component